MEYPIDNEEMVWILNLIDSYSDVIRNAKEFHNCIDDEDLIKKLSLFKHWYYIEEIDGFAPSKFIGYKDITIDEYKIGTSREKGYMDGRDTVSRLKQWFKLVDDKDYELYYKKLEEHLLLYDKKPNIKLQIYYKK